MTFKKIISYSLSLSLIVVAFGFSLNFMCFNRAFYNYEYTRLNTSESIGMSKEALQDTTEVLLGYLEGKKEDLNIEVEINGVKREVFNDKEKAHMVDVLKLYQNFNLVYYVAIGLFGISIISSFVLKLSFKDLQKAYQKVLLMIGALLMAIIFYYFLDFNAFWTQFHHIFFSNDLWLLDPSTDILIQMVPSAFFSDLILAIVTIFVTLLILYYILLYLLKRRTEHV